MISKHTEKINDYFMGITEDDRNKHTILEKKIVRDRQNFIYRVLKKIRGVSKCQKI